jgi:hypothetical protein
LRHVHAWLSPFAVLSCRWYLSRSDDVILCNYMHQIVQRGYMKLTMPITRFSCLVFQLAYKPQMRVINLQTHCDGRRYTLLPVRKSSALRRYWVIEMQGLDQRCKHETSYGRMVGRHQTMCWDNLTAALALSMCRKSWAATGRNVCKQPLTACTST